MNFTIIKSLNLRLITRLLVPCLLTVWFGISAGAQTPAVESGLIAHEWGTFTSVAGQDGKAVEWSPLSLPIDLPNFVEHFSYLGFKLGLRGTVRMETPVLYFYSPRDLTLSVHVGTCGFLARVDHRVVSACRCHRSAGRRQSDVSP